LRRLELFAVGIGQASALRIHAPPALEAPQALVAEAQARDPAAGAPRLARLEVEIALEHRRRAAPIGLALPGVEQDQTARAGPDLVDDARTAAATSAARRAPVARDESVTRAIARGDRAIARGGRSVARGGSAVPRRERSIRTRAAARTPVTIATRLWARR